MASLYFISKPRPIYLVDYTCCNLPDPGRVPSTLFIEHVQILERSGLGERTCVSPALHYIPPDPTIDDARAEAELIIFSAVMRMGIKPQDVDILIVNCSLFSLTPYLSDLVHANEYAVVVSTEIIFPNWYSGNQRSMLLPKSRATVQSAVWCMLCAPTVVLMMEPTAVFSRRRTPKEWSAYLSPKISWLWQVKPSNRISRLWDPSFCRFLNNCSSFSL
ncbi:hypothetical protein AMTRI_Chr13g84270 [Amborella trichopoda]